MPIPLPTFYVCSINWVAAAQGHVLEANSTIGGFLSRISLLLRCGGDLSQDPRSRPSSPANTIQIIQMVSTISLLSCSCIFFVLVSRNYPAFLHMLVNPCWSLCFFILWSSNPLICHPHKITPQGKLNFRTIKNLRIIPSDKNESHYLLELEVLASFLWRSCVRKRWQKGWGSKKKKEDFPPLMNRKDIK